MDLAHRALTSIPTIPKGPRFPTAHVCCILTPNREPEPAARFENEEDPWRSTEDSSLPASAALPPFR